MSTTTLPTRAQPLADLAAGLTDLGLEVLHRAGARGDSVAMELALWRALSAQLARELGAFRANEPLDGLVEQVVHRAALRVAGAFVPDRSPHELEVQARAGVAALRVSAGQRGALRRLFARLSRSEAVRPLQVTALN